MSERMNEPANQPVDGSANVSANEESPELQTADLTLTFEDDEGNPVQCTILYTFHAEHNDKHYMVYTTGVVSDEGEEVSEAKYDPAALEAVLRGEDAEVALEPLTEDIEWAIVADTLKRLVPDGVQVDDVDVVAEGVALQTDED